MNMLAGNMNNQQNYPNLPNYNQMNNQVGAGLQNQFQQGNYKPY